MAGKTFKLSIIVDATTAKATKGLGGLGKAIGGLAAGGALLGTAVVAGAALAGGALAKLAISAAPLEGIERAFEGIAEASGRSSKEMIAALQEGSAGMITQRDLMKSYNLAAQLVGDTFANQLPDAMGYLTKVAAATGEDMGYMMDSMVRGVGRLSPMILDNLGIQVDMAAAAQAWAEKGGAATATVVDNTEAIGKQKGAIAKLENQLKLANMKQAEFTDKTKASTRASNEMRIEELTGKLRDYRGELGDLVGAHGKASGSTKDLIKNMTKAQKQEALMAQVMEKLAENTANMPEVLGTAATRIAKLGAGFQDFKDRIGKAVLPILNQFLGILGDAAAVIFPKVGEAVEGLVGKFMEWQEKVLPILLERLGKVWNWITAVGIPNLKDLALTLVNWVIPIFQLFRGKVLPALFKVAAEFWRWITQTAIPVLMNWGKALLEILGPAFEQVQKLVGEAARAIEGGWPAIWEKLKEWGLRFWDWIIEVALPALPGALWKLRFGLIGWIIETIPGLKEKLAEWGRAFWDWVKEVAIPKGREKLGELRDYIVKWPTETWPGVKAQLIKWGNAFWDWVTEVAIPKAKEKLGELATTIWAWIEEVNPELALKLGEWAETFAGLWDEVKTSFAEFWEGFSPHLDEMYEDLMHFVDFIQPELATTWGLLKDLWDEIKETADMLSKAIFGSTEAADDFWKTLGDFYGALREFELDILIGLIVLAVEGLNVAMGFAIDKIKKLQFEFALLKAIIDEMGSWDWAGLLAGPRGPMGIPLPGLPGFQMGGTMPGAPGQAGLAILHGGETVTPAGGGRSVRIEGEAIQLLRAIAAKEGIVVVETGAGEGGRAADHLLSLGDRAWALPSGA